MNAWPNTRLQRTPLRAPLSRKPLGAGIKLVAVSAWMALSLVACTDCRDRVVQHAAGAGLTADVHERVCGSAAGFTVRVFPPGTQEKEGDAYDFEPFQTKCPPALIPKLAVVAAWRDPQHLEVRYSRALVVTRAEKQWKGVTITYVPVDPGTAGA